MNKQILRLAIPNMISNIAVPLAGMVDTAILGHLESEIYIGAVALGTLIFNYIYAVFGFLRMGTSGFTAQAFGEENKTEQVAIFGRALFIALAGGVLLILIQYPIELFSFWIIGGSPEVKILAADYFRIRIYAMPAMLGILALSGWFTGMQNAKYPMIMALSVNIISIVADLVFVLGFGMKSDGIAWGGLTAMYFGFIVGLLLFRKKYSGLLKNWSVQVFMNWKIILHFFRVNTDIIIRTVCLISTFAFFTSKSAGIDDTMLAVNTVLLQFFFLFSNLTDGFAFAAEALIGKFIGAGNRENLKKAIRHLFYWGVYISVPFSIIYFAAGSKIMSLLTNNGRVIQTAAPYMFWIGLIPIVTFAAFIWDGIYIGATSSVALRNSMLIATLVIFFPCFYGLSYLLGNHGLWLSMMIFMLSRGVLLTFYSKKYIYGLIS
jgi:multidrug resistance protein, MATE family